MPQLREQRPGSDVCGETDLRLYRDSVLEPGADPGDPGPGAPSVKNSPAASGLSVALLTLELVLIPTEEDDVVGDNSAETQEKIRIDIGGAVILY